MLCWASTVHATAFDNCNDHCNFHTVVGPTIEQCEKYCDSLTKAAQWEVTWDTVQYYCEPSSLLVDEYGRKYTTLNAICILKQGDSRYYSKDFTEEAEAQSFYDKAVLEAGSGRGIWMNGIENVRLRKVVEN